MRRQQSQPAFYSLSVVADTSASAVERKFDLFSIVRFSTAESIAADESQRRVTRQRRSVAHQGAAEKQGTPG